MRSSPWATSAWRDRLLGERTPDGHWEGELSSSPLSTATAVAALTLVGGHDVLIREGLRWLDANQNDDGGFGDAAGCPTATMPEVVTSMAPNSLRMKSINGSHTAA